jgi:mannose-6-phosphate isomerase-like protein (cupin superfamily)
MRSGRMPPSQPDNADITLLVDVARSRTTPVTGLDAEVFVRSATAAGTPMYANRNDRLNIAFAVERLAYPGIQTMDPRLVRIAPGRNNELHRHAHESLFVVIAGAGFVLIGDTRVAIATGDVAFVPRWVMHQTSNPGTSELVILAITDFGFTSAVLGDYDRRTRLAHDGGDAAEAVGES